MLFVLDSRVRITRAVNLKYPEVTTSFSLSLEVVLDGLAEPAGASEAAEAAGGPVSAFSSSMPLVSALLGLNLFLLFRLTTLSRRRVEVILLSFSAVKGQLLQV